MHLRLSASIAIKVPDKTVNHKMKSISFNSNRQLKLYTSAYGKRFKKFRIEDLEEILDFYANDLKREMATEIKYIPRL